MSTKATSTNEAETEENYEFAAMPRSGKVNVANHSHDDANEHTYTVSLDDGTAVSCTCPSDKYHSGRCKHREAVEETAGALRPGNCSCAGLTGLPCWQCFRFGFETPATEADA